MTEEPGTTTDQILRGLSMRRQIGAVVAGLGGSIVAGLVGLLWATEPQPLPGRTQIAFTVVILAGLAWAGFAAWALIRRPLFARDRVIAGWLGLVVSVLTAGGAIVISVARAEIPGVLAAAGAGAVLVAVAGVMLRRALNYRAALLARWRELS